MSLSQYIEQTGRGKMKEKEPQAVPDYRCQAFPKEKKCLSGNSGKKETFFTDWIIKEWTTAEKKAKTVTM